MWGPWAQQPHRHPSAQQPHKHHGWQQTHKHHGWQQPHKHPTNPPTQTPRRINDASDPHGGCAIAKPSAVPWPRLMLHLLCLKTQPPATSCAHPHPPARPADA